MKGNMLKVLALVVGLSCATALTARAADGEKKGSEDRKALIEKYDKNKDGKLDRDERKAMTAEDKEKWQKGSGGGKKKKDQ